MRRRFIGGAVWLFCAACLYFFENNTGTRIVLLGSLAAFLLPPVRAAFFGADASRDKERPTRRTVKDFFPQPEEEEPGDVRLYQPGDPVRRIHWKLSAKRGELLIRESEAVTDPREEKRTVPSPETAGKECFRARAIWVLIAVTVFGSVFGVVGLITAVPLMALLYTLFSDYIAKRLERKEAVRKRLAK